MLGFHFSLFVERISRLFPKCIIILTREMEVHGYKKKKNTASFKKSSLFFIEDSQDGVDGNMT